MSNNRLVFAGAFVLFVIATVMSFVGGDPKLREGLVLAGLSCLAAGHLL